MSSSSSAEPSKISECFNRPPVAMPTNCIVLQLYRLILLFLHKLLRLKRWIRVTVERVYHRHWSTLKVDSRLKAKLQAKLPKHLALGLGPSERLNFETIGQVARWCQLLDIATLTIFHYDQQENAANAMHFDGVNVALVPLKGSHQSLVEAARFFAQLHGDDHDDGDDGHDQSKLTSDDISEHLLKHSYPNPDPELLICCNGTPSYGGFPIWQIRLTEIVFLDALSDLTESRFVQELIRFSRCEQRFGA